MTIEELELEVEDLQAVNADLKEQIESLRDVHEEFKAAQSKLEYVAERFANELELFTPYAKRRWIESDEA